VARRRSLYLDRSSSRRSSYSSSYGRHQGGGFLRKVAITLVLLVLVVIGAGVYQWTRGVPAQQVNADYKTTVTAPGGAAGLPWPHEGQAAVAVVGGAAMAWPATGARPAPIASLAKMMTAYQILTDHPLGAHGTGPTLRVTAADVSDYRRRAARQESVLAVRAGERLSEYKALQALLIPSANNVATILARWDAGSVPKFVAKMNATAKQLGLTTTHYADPDGTSAHTVSTAVDQLSLAQKAMTQKMFAAIVRQPVATFPFAGSLFNYDFEIGHHGFIGIKTGSDAAAGGCWAFAARRTVDGKPSVVYGVVLGQHAKKTGALIQPALALGRRLADATPKVVRRVTLVTAGTTVGTLHAPWRDDVPLTTKQNLSVVASPGQKYAVHLQLHAPTSRQVAAGTVVGTLTVAGVSTPVVVAHDAAGPAVRWRLTRR
jgi:serine-type D-Ala-D-Ala carboxypeptidase (penicillin-binding protein 5/6)